MRWQSVLIKENWSRTDIIITPLALLWHGFVHIQDVSIPFNNFKLRRSEAMSMVHEYSSSSLWYYNSNAVGDTMKFGGTPLLKLFCLIFRAVSWKVVPRGSLTWIKKGHNFWEKKSLKSVSPVPVDSTGALRAVAAGRRSIPVCKSWVWRSRSMHIY